MIADERAIKSFLTCSNLALLSRTSLTFVSAKSFLSEWNSAISFASASTIKDSKLAQVPGVNPIEFDNLEDYTEFLEWQKSQNIRCPVLYLQESYDAQGTRVYKSRPSVSEPQAGLPPSYSSIGGDSSQITPMMQENSLEPVGEEAYPNPTLLVDATRNDPPYNKNSYPAYDESSFYVGSTTPLDKMDIEQEKAKVSPNAMEPNWGGSAYTQSLIDKGYYKDNEVKIAIE